MLYRTLDAAEFFCLFEGVLFRVVVCAVLDDCWTNGRLILPCLEGIRHSADVIVVSANCCSKEVIKGNSILETRNFNRDLTDRTLTHLNHHVTLFPACHDFCR